MMSIKSRRRIVLNLLIVVGVLMASASSGRVVASHLGPPEGPIGLQCTDGPTFDLIATDGYIYTPDGNTVYMWSYTNDDPGDPDDGVFQLPGPVLCVKEDEMVTVNLTNDLPEPVSIIFPGQTGVTATGDLPGLFTAEAAGCAGGPPCTPGTATYTFKAEEPGTYLYESGTLPQKQVQMGLYGALIVYPTDYPTSVTAYGDPGSTYDSGREYLILLSEIDPELHYAVEHGLPYDVTTFHPTYWTINGRSFPDNIAPNGAPWLPNQPYSAVVQVNAIYPDDTTTPSALIRYANVGLANHPFHPHGDFLTVIARDGRRLTDEFENFTRTIGSGQTYDLLFDWRIVDPWIEAGGDPVPVTIPGLQNLIFKDGFSFYSGDPELGETGEFPVGTTVYNGCGEFYFPWHTHAVFEFTNFNEGFGGMGTVVRVDKPGGCSP